MFLCNACRNPSCVCLSCGAVGRSWMACDKCGTWGPCVDCRIGASRAPAATPVPPTLPAAAPWYAEGSCVDFSMSELFTFGLVLDGLDAFDEVSSVLRYFEKPWKWSGEYARWVELGRPVNKDLTVEKSEYILDAGTKAKTFAEWKAQNAEADA